MLQSTIPTKKQKMTAETAKTFDRFSIYNAKTVIESLPCGCLPYQDVFTFKRWIAQGYCVKRGEHGIKIPVIGSNVKELDNGELSVKRYTTTSAVFCRCQVVKLEGKK